MDPNEALRQLRIYVEALNRFDAECAEEEYTDTGTLWDIANGLRDHAEALDGWLSRGGFLPTAWSGDRA